MKAWKSDIIEGSISMHDLRALVEKTVAIPTGAVFTAFITWNTDELTHKVELLNGVRFEILLRDAGNAKKQG